MLIQGVEQMKNLTFLVIKAQGTKVEEGKMAELAKKLVKMGYEETEAYNLEKMILTMGKYN